MARVCVGIIANRDAAGNFLPAKPIYKDIDNSEINKNSKITKTEEKCCDSFANIVAKYIQECRKAGINLFE